MSDLLAELKAEREKHKPIVEEWGIPPTVCSLCVEMRDGDDGEYYVGAPWPCPLSRALDCAIAGLATLRMLAETNHRDDHVWCGDLCYTCEAKHALETMSRTWEGEHAEK